MGRNNIPRRTYIIIKGRARESDGTRNEYDKVNELGEGRKEVGEPRTSRESSRVRGRLPAVGRQGNRFGSDLGPTFLRAERGEDFEKLKYSNCGIYRLE